MPVTGTPITVGAGRTLAQIFASLIARPIAETLGISPAFSGKLSRAQVVVMINDIINELAPYYPARYAADLLFTDTRVYDVSSDYSPAVLQVYDVKVPTFSGGPLVQSRRWNYDKIQQTLYFDVKPALGITAQIYYTASIAPLSSDSDTVYGELTGNEQLITSGVLGLCGSTKDWGNYSKEKKMLVIPTSSRLMFPRKLR